MTMLRRELHIVELFMGSFITIA